MELTIKDRLYIPALLPKEGNFRDFNNKKEILRKIEITAANRDEIGLHENKDTGRIEWATEKEMPLMVDFSQQELEYLKAACEKISDQSLPDDMWASVEKIYDALACES